MRLLEVALAVGVAILVIGWGAGWTGRLRLVPALAAALVGHLVLEGARLVMAPIYLAVGIAAAGWVLGRGVPRPPARRGWRGAVRRVSGVGLAIGAILPAWLWPVIRLPRPTGPHPVGSTWIVVRDSTRPERFGGGAVREFPVRLWYPAAPGPGAVRAGYAVPEEVGAIGAFPPALFRQLRLARTHAWADAPLPPGTERYPVLVFSHGYTGYASQNTPQMEELASQGYVVASIVHPGEASWAPFPDGRGIPIDSGVMAGLRGQMGADRLAVMMAALGRIDSARTRSERIEALRAFLDLSPEPLRTESVAEWAADTRALVDRLEGLDRGGDSPWSGRLALDRLGVFGMSYGGATAGEFCRLDPRCRAAVNIDGAQYGGLIGDSLTVPLLIIASEQAAAVHRPVLDLARGPAFLVTVPATTHMGLTDLSLIGPVLFRVLGVTGRLDPDRRMEILTGYLTGFFDTYLRDRPSVLLAGPSARYPDVPFVRNATP